MEHFPTKHKVDHKEGETKDTADAVAGVVHSITLENEGDTPEIRKESTASRDPLLDEIPVNRDFPVEYKSDMEVTDVI